MKYVNLTYGARVRYVFNELLNYHNEDLMNTDNIFYYIGGYSVFILGLSSWIGSILATKISSRQNHAYSKDIEKLKNDLEIYSHGQKLIISRYDELRANALQEVHEKIVDLEFFVGDQLGNIHNKWNEAFENSQKKITKSKEESMQNEDDIVQLPDNYTEMMEEKIKLQSKLALAEGIIRFIAYESFSKWQPKFRELKEFVLKKEIFIDQDLFNEIVQLISRLEKQLNLSVRTISGVAKESLDKDGVVEEIVSYKIKESFNELQKDIWDNFKPVKIKITYQIRKYLDPFEGNLPKS